MNMNVSERETYLLNRDQQVEHMKKALEIGVALWDHLYDTKEPAGEDKVINVISTPEIKALFEAHFPVPLEPIRINYFLRGFMHVLEQEEGPNTCALWRTLHLIDHAIYDPIETF